MNQKPNLFVKMGQGMEEGILGGKKGVEGGKRRTLGGETPYLKEGKENRGREGKLYPAAFSQLI